MGHVYYCYNMLQWLLYVLCILITILDGLLHKLFFTFIVITSTRSIILQVFLALLLLVFKFLQPEPWLLLLLLLHVLLLSIWFSLVLPSYFTLNAKPYYNYISITTVRRIVQAPNLVCLPLVALKLVLNTGFESF